MENLENMTNQFDNTVRGWLSVVDDNQYVSTALSLFLIIYAAYAVPKLPGYVLRIFDNPLVKLLLFFLIAYTARRNPTVAIIAAVGVLVTLQALNKMKLDQMMMGLMQREAMEGNRGRSEMGRGMGAMAEMEQGNMSMEDMRREEMGMPREAFEEIEEEINGGEEGSTEELLPAPPTPGTQCVKQGNYRNDFYPQYVNMKPDAYMARYSGNEVNGFDPNSGYASI